MKLTAHGFRRGYVLRLKITANPIEEVFATIHKIIDADSFELSCILSQTLVAGDTFDVYEPRITRASDSGSLVADVNGEPVSFTFNGSEQAVIKDDVTPANNRPLPVEILGFEGGSISINADDLNIRLSAFGATFDSIRIADGTNTLTVDAGGQALVKDAESKTALDALLLELEKKSDLTETQPVSLAALPLPGGASTAVNQSTVITRLGDLIVELQKKSDLTETQPVSIAALPLPSGSSTAANQATLISALGNLLSELQTKADLSETQPVSLTALPLPTGAATAVNQTTTNAKLDTVIAKLPSSLGAKDSANSFPVVLSTDQVITSRKLDVVDQLDTPLVDSSVSNIPGALSSPLKVVDSLAADTKAIHVIDDLGEFVGLYDGSDTLICILPQGFTGTILEVNIPSGTELKIRNMKNADISIGHIAINFLG